MSSPGALVLRKTMEKRAADMLEQSRADGKGPLFSDQQLKLLADMCAAEGNVTALYLEAYTAQLRKMLPAKATGEELVAWMEESVKHPEAPQGADGHIEKWLFWGTFLGPFLKNFLFKATTSEVAKRCLMRSLGHGARLSGESKFNLPT